MSIIDGVNVAVYKCDCGEDKLWFFRGQDGEGYKIACPVCGKDQWELLEELHLPYLWQHKESPPILVNLLGKVQEVECL